MYTNRSKGFTLIELLVVIAIIAILAGILFPVFAQAREKARQTTCLSNEKEIALAVLMYVQDYNECYPCAFFKGESTTGQEYSWDVAVSPYIKSGTITTLVGAGDAGDAGNGIRSIDSVYPGQAVLGGVFTCPSDANSVTQQNEYVVRDDVFPETAWMSTDPSNVAYLSNPVVTDAEIPDPANRIMAWETGSSGGKWGQPDFDISEYAWTTSIGAPYNGLTDIADIEDCDDPAGAGAGSQSDACYEMPRYRHNNTSNFMFLDGHVKSIAKGRLNWWNNLYITGLCDFTNGPAGDWCAAGIAQGWFPW